ncbi:MAG: sigma-54-dependent Fis family transcriptional regulator [Phycisphaerales bacterium]|nr:sigma-54-dependent Fis family transcriptional regulator [Phycisphaerales bacterium]
MADVPFNILIVDDDVVVAESIAEFLRRDGYHVNVVHSGEEALRELDDAVRGHAHRPAEPYAVMIADMRLPGMTGLDLIRRARDHDSAIMPIAITGFGTIEDAVATVKFGAIDYLTKPLIEEELRLSVERAIQQHKLVAENSSLRRQLNERYALEEIVGQDDRMRRIFDIVHAVAPSRTTVLMCGESGTGKSMIARAVHRLSPRAEAPFVELSCGSIPETLLESELFGHVRGAFTGAHADKKGRFLAAHGGTLFLDEINSASPGMQLKLLRVLQERILEPVGSDAPVEVDVRIILASNQPLEDLVARGDFRQDLYYRINVVTIDLPPLRERAGDATLLFEHFVRQAAGSHGLPEPEIGESVRAAVAERGWPGNVRELQNAALRFVLDQGLSSEPAPIDPATVEGIPGNPGRTLADRVAEFEAGLIQEALDRHGGELGPTESELSISRRTLHEKIRRYGLTRRR